jgi:hypothetical protein
MKANLSGRESNAGFGADLWPRPGPGEVYAWASSQGETLAQQANSAITNANNLLSRHAEKVRAPVQLRGPLGTARRVSGRQRGQVS